MRENWRPLKSTSDELEVFADHCVPALVVRVLQDEGHEVFVIKEHIPPDSKDPTVIAKAQELDAILVSLNGEGA